LCSNRSYTCDLCVDNGKYCGFIATYETCNLTDPTQSCSVKCLVIDDTMILGSQSGNMVFGVIYWQQKNFQQFFYIDGVVGFIPGASSFRGTSAFQRLVDLGKYQNIFAMCLNPYHGGVLTLGGIDSNLQSGEFEYTPLEDGLGYTVEQKAILVNGIDIGVAPIHSTIVDSGTNVLLQPSQHFSALQGYFQSTFCPSFPIDGICGSKNLFTGECYNYNQSDIALFPNISLELKGATLTMTGFQYLITNGTNSDLYCLGISSTGIDGLSIIGDVVMQGYYVVFDGIHQRLGWAPVNAETCMRESGTATSIWEL